MSVQVIAHRGSSLRAPENTMAAFALAIRERADGIELDVRESADGQVIVLHDPDLNRVASRPGLAAKLSARELQTIDVGNGERVPLLDEVLDLVDGLELTLHVEIKGDTPSRARTARVVAETLMRRTKRAREKIVVSSFYPQILSAVRKRCGVRIAFLFDREHTGLVRAGLVERLLGPDGVHPQGTTITPERMARWRSLKRFVNAWTIDRPEDVRTLRDLGVDGLITNDPVSTRAALVS